MAKQLLGRVAMDFKGEFNSSATYEKLDVVVYEGCSYCTLKETKGNLPTNEEFFALLVRKPIEGLDYFTEDEKEEFVSRITDDANSLFNQNVESKTKEFNANHQNKVNDFNNNYDTKLSSFNNNYDNKVKSFDDNVNNQTISFDKNVVEKQKEFDDNVTNQAETFNSNATNKINEYDTNASSKLNDYNSNNTTKLKVYNDNASTKVEEYNTNVNNKVEEFNANAEEKTNEFNSTANAQKVTNLSNEFYRVKDEVLETGESSDTFIHLEDTSMSELQELEIEGVCQQDKTEGYQLLKIDNSTRTNRGITSNILNNIFSQITGTFELQYANVSDTSITHCNLESGQTYTIALNRTISNQLIFKIGYIDGTTQDNVIFSETDHITFQTTQDVSSVYFFIRGTVGSTISISNLKVLIYKGEYDASKIWENYTGEQQSPNPEYSQTIRTITDDLKITSCGKNFFDKDNAIKGFYYTGRGILDSSDNWYYENIKIQPNEFYTVSGNNYNNETAYIVEFDSSMNFIKAIANYKNVSLFKTSSNASFIGVSVPDYKGTADLNTFQLEKGLSASSYESYQKTSIYVTIPKGEFIGKFDDTYKDTLSIRYNESDSEYHLILNKMLRKEIFDGSENWSKSISFSSDTTPMFFFNDDKYSSSFPLISSHFIKGSFAELRDTTNENNMIGHAGNSLNIKIKKSIINGDTVEAFKNWLINHNIEVYSVIKNPYEIDLGPVEMPLSYNKVTNIFIDSDLLPKINVKYYRDFKQTIKNINDNIDGIKNDYVKNSDVASSSKAGILKIGNGCYLKANTLTASVYNYDAYQTRGNEFFISKGTLENVLKAKILELKSELGVSTTDESEETE